MGGRSGQAVRASAQGANEVTSFENDIAKNSFETAGFIFDGKVVFQKKGTERAVDFTLSDLRAAMEAAGQKDFSQMTITHNHPTQKDGSIGGSFSEPDLAFFIKYRFGAIRAVDAKYTYELKGNDKLFSMDARVAKRRASTLKGLLTKMYNQEAKKTIRVYETFSSFNKAFREDGFHRVMERFTARYGNEVGFTYKRTER
jgi:hypothetical protein